MATHIIVAFQETLFGFFLDYLSDFLHPDFDGLSFPYYEGTQEYPDLDMKPLTRSSFIPVPCTYY